MNTQEVTPLERHTLDDGSGKPFTVAVGGVGFRQSVLLLPAIAGIDDYITHRAGHLIAHGYQVAVLDYYGPSGKRPDLSTPERIGAAVAELDDREVILNIRRAQSWLTGPAIASERVGLLGFCIGASYAIQAAADSNAPACAVAYYGQLRNSVPSEKKPVEAMDAAGRLRAPLLGHFGDMDRLISVQDINELAGRLRAAQCAAEVHVYPGAPHAFDEWHRPAVFRPIASADAWRRSLLFLDWHLRSMQAA